MPFVVEDDEHFSEQSCHHRRSGLATLPSVGAIP